MSKDVTGKEPSDGRKVRGPYKKKSPSRGGPRPNSGRPKGSTNKLSAADLLNSLENELGRPYAEQLAKNYKKTIDENNTDAIRAYDTLIVNKIVATKIEQDVTSNGETVGVTISFGATDLAEWKDD